MHHRTLRGIAAAVALTVAVAACGGQATGTIEEVTPRAAAELLAEPPAGLVVLDVRTPEEFAGGHLAGATNIDFYAPDFRTRLDALDKDVPYLVYCRSGNRSAQAVDLMRDLGFSQVYDVQGGILAWTAAGLPLGP